MSLWKKISLGVPIVIMLLPGAAAFLVGTATGLHLLFNAANLWVPGLEIGQVIGGWRDLRLQNISYEQPGVAVSIGEFHLAVKLGCLLDHRLCINNLLLTDVNVAIDSNKMLKLAQMKKNSGPLDLSQSYPITLGRIVMNNINLKIDGTTVSVMSFSSGLRWQDKNLTLTPTLLHGLRIIDFRFNRLLSHDRNPQPEEKLFVEQLKAFFLKPVLPEEVTDVHLPLNLDIEEFKGEQLCLIGDTNLTVYNLLLKISSIDDQMQLNALDINSNQGMLKATGTAKLRDSWPINVTLNGTLNIDPIHGEKVTLKASGALRDWLEMEVNLSDPVDMTLRAQTRLDEAGLPLNLEVVSKQIYWPFTGERQFQADEFKMKLIGKMTNYALSFRTVVKRQGLPFATITLNAKGNERQVTIDPLTVAALDGKTKFTALIDWQQAISWRGELNLEGINTANKVANWPTKMNGLIKTCGSLYGGGSWQMTIPKLKITGNINKENPFNVEGSLKGNSNLQWIIPGLHVALGSNSANIKGELGIEELNLDAAIDAPKLDNVLPGLGGIAKALVKVRGTVDAPQLLADINAIGLRWQELTIARVKMAGEVKSNDQISGHLNVRVEHIAQPGINISLAKLDVKGNERQHALQLCVHGEPIFGQLHLAGSFDRQAEHWKGTLADTRFATPVGPWTLIRKIKLDYHHRSAAEPPISIGPHCWKNPKAKLCFPQTIDAGVKGRAMVNFNCLDLAIFKSLMPDATQASGVFSGKADMAWDIKKKQLTQGSLTLSGRNVKVNQEINDAPLAVIFDTLNLKARLCDNHAELGWLIRLTNNGQFDGQVQIANPHGRRHLSGGVNIRNLNLALANTIFASGEKAAGMLNANLRLVGNNESPRLFGQIQVNGVDIAGNFMPFDMQPSQLVMKFNGMQSTLSGVVRTRQGEINLSGDADWSHLDSWRARIAVKGSRVRITVPRIARLDVSPGLVLEATPSLFTLNGKVNIPWARIVVHEMPKSAIAISSDEIMLNENLKPVETRSASIPIHSNLIVQVGNNVRMNAFGLKAKLTGNLKVVQDQQGLGLNGQINILDGRFQAYGQDLIVRKGILLFSGPPDQPVLNIEAIRNPESTENNVIAGVRFTALADELKAEIFSEPAMSQQEAFFYLLRGQGMNSNQKDSAAMTSMLVGLGVAKSGQIVGRIGETFGVSNLALDTQVVGDSSQVVVSGYVLPGLQVKYGLGLFDSLATLTLRYRLMPKLYLEAVSGVDQALDLIYQFEF